ncbi:phosphoserine phosphatase/homoserine phosphotransferase bifunctional protein [Alkalispirochaeta sphaeroplastigenens]|uniref:phosphoserine phosphatase n=1 Tax=Alkalispirochaeta sphaeroplastigenens TaxID=1187066 RepID=A0A2S4JRW3_9SPIO|nr:MULTISPECIES: bifunctional phosphoserine phosphatase/homoserine phosphotransferase ThrH [Alkalispirochaeta]POR02251.1 phosphoserine phosphatase/homoserine phosphotransferase bifunctional protein [Alkalispirochaeta sphaeroplastigenens]
MRVICLDLEGVLVPEIWLNVAREAGVEELNITTRDIPDYHELMKTRLGILDRHRIGLPEITRVIASMEPLPGAADFLDSLREETQVIILSDTFEEFASPLMRQLKWPTLFCNSLEVTSGGRITGYRLRQEDGKRQAVQAFASMNLEVVAAGDSWNDLHMILEADRGAFFCPPASMQSAHPSVPVCNDYTSLRDFLLQ